jgi:hypothetical protein
MSLDLHDGETQYPAFWRKQPAEQTPNYSPVGSVQRSEMNLKHYSL